MAFFNRLKSAINSAVSLLKSSPKYLTILIKSIRTHWFRWLLGVVLLTVLWFGFLDLQYLYEFRDDDPGRGAVVVSPDLFGDEIERIVYLDQGWNPDDSMRFYNITEGSNLMPYDFFLVLEQKESESLFRDNANIDKYRYLPQYATDLNPDALPVGMTLDTYQGKRYMGFTCAACHTTQINYQNVGIRIDGGPAASDMENFMVDLAASMRATLTDEKKQARFVQSVLALKDYRNEVSVVDDLTFYTERIESYTVINRPVSSQHPLTTYGYARLDAFGRIYNRVLEHIISFEEATKVLEMILSPEELEDVLQDVSPVLSDNDMDHILEKVQKYLSTRQILRLRDELFNPPDAPASYPFLWDIPQHDYVQWNGVVSNSGIGPIGRNAGQVIGVFGTLDWKEMPGFTLSSVLSGQGFGDSHINFDSSIDIRNLRRVETQLRKLQSPEWPSEIFGALDQDKIARGEKIFVSYCESCHARIDRKDPDRRVIAHMSSIESVKTDPKAALNGADLQGYSGILRNEYVSVGPGPGSFLLERKAPVAALLTLTTTNAILTPDRDKLFFRRWSERIFDFATAFFENKVKLSTKKGDYTPDTTQDPLASLRAYKGRSLNGIWATAPYLHNGSVPTLYDLLLPKKQPGDPDDGEYRPDEFRVGSRTFDPDRVGFKYEGYDGFLFRTDIYGNYNSGHEYAAGITRLANGEPLPALDEPERRDLLEFLKSL
jgi:hypothetical protein